MSAVGYAVLPTTISLSGLSKELQKQVLEPTRKAAKQAAETMEKGIGAGAEAAGRAVEKANFRVMKSTQEQEAAESKLAEQKLKTEAANLAVEAAARKRADAETKGVEAVEKAEQELLKKRAAAEKASRDLRTAEAGVEKALSESARAADNLAEKQSELAKTTDEASNALEVASDKGEGFNISMKDAALGIGAFVTAAAGVGAGLVAIGTQFDDMYDTIRVGTGASGDAFAGLQDSARAVAAEIPAMDGGLEQIGTTLADLNTRLGLTGEPLETMTAQFVQLQNLGIDADINDVTGALTQFGVSAEDAPASLDMLFQISQATGRSITDLTSNLSKSGPALQEFGFGLEESAGLLGALDKAGLDSEKTLGSMTRALSDFAKDGKDPQQALWGTIASIDELTAAGKNAEAIDLANSIFGAKGGAGFVSAVESGKFEYDDFLDSIGATEDTILGVASETADFAESWQLFKQKAMLAVEPVAMMLFDQLAPAIEKGATAFEDLVGWVTDDLIPAMQDLGAWFQRNEEWIKPLAVTVGVLTAGYVALAAQQSIMAAGGFLKWLSQLNTVTKLQATYTKIATGVQTAFNVVLNANPIALVAIAVAGLVAGLIYFFTQTETGRELWGKFTTALSDGWDRAVGALTAGWETIKTGVFDAWNNGVAFIQASWNLATNALAFAWAWVKDQFVTTWTTVKTAVFDAWNTYVNNVKSNWDTITGAIVAAWTWTKDQFVYVWTVVKATVFDAWNAAVETVRSVFDTVTSKISESWTWLKDNLVTTWTTVKTTVFDAMTSSLDTVKGWFDKTVDAIGTTWDKLKALTAKPVRFVVETVYGGLRNAWNKVAGLVGLGELPEVPLGNLGAYARGGVLPGYTPGRDVHEFYSPTGGRIHLSGGEAIMRPEWVRAVGGPSAVDEMNRAAREGKSLAAGPHDHYALGGVWDLGAFANGGTLRKNPGVVLTTDIQRSMERAVAAAFPNQIITSATRYQEMGSGYDNHMAGRALDFAASHALADWIARTYPNSAELFWDPGPNLKNGARTGAIGGHSDHVHWAMASMVDPYTGEVVSQDGPGGGGGFSLLGMAKGMWDKAIGAIGKFPGAETMGTIGKLPAAALSTLATGAWNFLRDKFAAVGSFFGGGGGGEQYRGQIEAAFRNQGEVPHKHLVDALVRQIDTESGGDPNIAQQIVDVNGTGPSAGLGLYQFIPGTFAAYRDPSLPNDRTDPWAAHNAAVRYFRDRHGWNTGPGGVGRGHGWKSGGVLPADLTTLFDTGGVWKHGTAGVNLSGADEYVFTNKAMRDFQLATESLADTARNLRRGFEEWAAASEEQDRMGTPAEWVQHFGGQWLASTADDLMGLVGLDGIIGGRLRPSLVNLINTGADNLNDVYGTRFGHIDGSVLAPRSILDDEGRAAGTKLTPVEQPPATDVAAAAAGGVDATSTTATVTEPPVKEIIFEVKGDAVTTEKVSEMFDQLNGEIGDAKVRIKKLESGQTASVTSGITGIA